MDQFGKTFAKEWKQFVLNEKLSEKQEEQFEAYFSLLSRENERINLTAITEPISIVAHHFRDSLQLRHAIDLKSIKSLCDVGTGAGFPGIPLKIIAPHLQVVLIEVNHKKIKFLELLISRLGLEGCEVCPLDWRTFLRKTDHEIDFFCVRASLKTDELIRLFKPSCPYKDADLVYWASSTWEPSDKVKPFIKREEFYKIKRRNLKLVFLSSINSTLRNPESSSVLADKDSGL